MLPKPEIIPKHMGLLPSLGQPNDISSQTVVDLTEISLLRSDEYFTASFINSLFY